MGDSGLTDYLAIAALAVILLAFVMTAVAWRIPKRPVRIGIGLALMVLGLLDGVVLSFVAFVLVTGLGVTVFVLGIRTRRADPPNGGLGQ